MKHRFNKGIELMQQILKILSKRSGNVDG